MMPCYHITTEVNAKKTNCPRTNRERSIYLKIGPEDVTVRTSLRLVHTVTTQHTDSRQNYVPCHMVRQRITLKFYSLTRLEKSKKRRGQELHKTAKNVRGY